MELKNNPERMKDQKMVASSYFIFALLLLLSALSIPFTENFSLYEFFIAGFGVILIGYGSLLLINPYRRLKLFNRESIYTPKPSIYNIGGIKKMIYNEKFFNLSLLKSSPKINISVGIIIMLFGITLIIMAFVSHY